MKTAIVYYSHHHGNTKKLLDAIAARHEVTLIDAARDRDADLSSYDRIGFASGIYYGGFAKQVVSFAKDKLPQGKEVFFIATCGASPSPSFFNGIRTVTNRRKCTFIGQYICNGYDTFGPFKLVGGIKQGHPDEEEIKGAVEFYCGLFRSQNDLMKSMGFKPANLTYEDIFGNEPEVVRREYFYMDENGNQVTRESGKAVRFVVNEYDKDGNRIRESFGTIEKP